MRVVTDGAPESWFDEIVAFTVCPDGSRCAYTVGADGRARVILDGEAGPVFDDIPEWARPAFSADGHHVVYGAHTDGRDLLVIDRDVVSDVTLTRPPPVWGRADE